MKHMVSPNVLAAGLAEETVLLHLGSKRYFRLNATGAVLWKGLEQGLDRAALVERLTSEFDVDTQAAAAETDRLLAELTRLELVEASNS